MDTSALTPMTEIDAINDMLSLISESPVASLDEANQTVDAQIAMQILARENRAVQEIGWYWNTEHRQRFAPDLDGNIVLPTNTLDVRASDALAQRTYRYTYRQGKLFDRTNQTFNVGQAVYLDVTYTIPFEDLPPTARRYIALLAGRKFENRMISDASAHKINYDDVILAKSDLLNEEAENQRMNVVTGSQSVRRVVVGRLGLRGEI